MVCYSTSRSSSRALSHAMLLEITFTRGSLLLRSDATSCPCKASTPRLASLHSIPAMWESTGTPLMFCELASFRRSSIRVRALFTVLFAIITPVIREPTVRTVGSLVCFTKKPSTSTLPYLVECRYGFYGLLLVALRRCSVRGGLTTLPSLVAPPEGTWCWYLHHHTSS